MENPVAFEIRRIVDLLASTQCADGAWRFCFESGPMTDAYMLITAQVLGLREPELVEQLATRILRIQADNGAWRLYADEASGGNLSATVEAYYGLLASGLIPVSDERIQQARQFIMAKGGLDRVGTTTKVILALTGQLPWKRYSLPVEFMLFPKYFPLNFFDFVGYARVHVAPVLLGAGRRLKLPAQSLPDLGHLRIQPNRPQKMDRVVVPSLIRNRALQRTEQFVLNRIEADGTLYSYASATFLMVLSLLSVGYPAQHPVIIQAVKGLKALIYSDGKYVHLQNSTSTVWDTALLSYALQAADMPESAPCIQAATQYLLNRQQCKRADWAIYNPRGPAGGWGFSDGNTMNPDVDDTAAALRAISAAREANPGAKQAWQRGVNWLLSMQNDDGGWPAFERNLNKGILSAIQIDGAKTILTDPSTSDLTGRTLEFLGSYAGYHLSNKHVSRATRWLLRQQEPNGSWRGRWGISYIYGTWAALTGLIAVGIPCHHPAVQRGVHWLMTIQQPDGGWGESCNSEIQGAYIPLHCSTLSQTAWALDALISTHEQPVPALEKAVAFLAANGQSTLDTATYPTGAGLPGGFHIHYHSYRFVWPLLALGHYRSKYGTG